MTCLLFGAHLRDYKAKRFVRESSLNAAIERLLLSSFVAGSNLWNFLNAFHTQNFRVGGLNVGDFELAH